MKTMKTLSSFVCLASAIALAAYACTSEHIEKEPSITAGSSGAEAGTSGAGLGGTGAGVGGASGVGGQTPSGNGGEAGNNGSAGSASSGCPTTGTKMVRVTSPAGVAYCIDRAEVTQQQYAKFLEAKNGDSSGQDEWCSGVNPTYEPRIKDGDDDLLGCPEGIWSPKEKGGYPVECIDLCDARAYCAWAGKRLCGRIGGGVQSFDPKAMNDPEQSQWYNACSQGGKFPYSYGEKVDTTKCSEYGPVDADAACHSQEPPFNEIMNLSGNLGEFEDVDTTGEEVTIIQRAPKLLSDKTYRCDQFGSVSAGRVSFRCCADL